MIKMTRQELGYSTPQIGKYLGRHHATILNSLKVFDQIFQYDKTFAKRHQRAEQIYLQTIKQINEKAAALRGIEDSTH
jgi:chromosomal replication initiation ATPase DnaA